MNRRLFIQKSILGLCAAAILPITVVKSWHVPAVSMLHDGTRWRKVSELYIDPRCLEDIRRWGVDEIDEATRREIICSAK